MKVLINNASIWKWENVPLTNRKGFVLKNCCVCVENGRITSVSDYEDQFKESKEQFDTIIDAQEKLLLPGLNDAHIHVGMVGESQYFVDLQKCYSLQSLQEKLSLHALKFPELPWVIGVNWDQTKLGRYPSRHDLDSLDCKKPMYLWRACWHIGVANTAALQLANVLTVDGTLNAAQSIDIPGGVVELDVVSGLPTGILKETAVELITATVAHHKSPEHKLKYLSEGLALCARLGLTAVQTNDDHTLAVYQQLQRESRLPLRVFLTPNYDELHHSVADKHGILGVRPIRHASLASKSTSINSGEAERDLSTAASRLVVERLKVYSDGSLGAETAALRTADTTTCTDSTMVSSAASVVAMDRDGSRHSGVLVHKSESLRDIVRNTMAAGYRIEIHAIGDAAAEQVLDALEHNLPSSEVSEQYRPIITHCQVLGDDLIERMARGGVIANIQPSFVPTDMRWVETRLSVEKQRYSYAWKTLLDRGVFVAGGSDAPIESPSPFIGMYDAVHRSNKMRLTGGGGGEVEFRPEEKLTFAEALWLYTIGAAYAAKCEDVLGQIEVGFAADLVLVDPRVVNDPSLLHHLQPDLVMVGGCVSHASPDFSHSITAKDSTTCAATVFNISSALASPFHDAPYIPGKGGCIPRVGKYSVRDAVTERQHDTSGDCDVQNESTIREAFCACILKGKYCMESSLRR